MSFRFGEFTLDLDRRLLLQGAEAVHLAPKALDLLALLIRLRPNAVSKKEIFQALWPDTFVTANVLPTLVSDLRIATGDDARRPRFIRTIHGFGYAFEADAVDLARGDSAPPVAPSKWSLIWVHGHVSLRLGENIIGRSGERVL